MTAKPEKVEPDPSWTDQEKWVWSKLLNGEIADFNAYPRFGGKLDPKNDELWTEDNEIAKNRILTPKFLQTILLNKPHRSAIPRQGVNIDGAWFVEPVELFNATLSHVFGLCGCRFDSSVYLMHLKTTAPISFSGSKFAKKLLLNGLQAESNFSLHGNAQFNEVDLVGAKVGGQLNMIGSKFTGTLDMKGLEVDKDLLMRSKFKSIENQTEVIELTQFHEVELIGSTINGYLNMDGSKFTGKLNMNGLYVKDCLFMRNGAEFNEVELASSKVGEQLNMNGSKFTGKLNMNGLHVGSNLLMTERAEFNEVAIVNAKVNDQINMNGSKFTGKLNMNGLKLGGSLFMSNGAKFKKLSLIVVEIDGQINMNGATFNEELHIEQAKIMGDFFIRNVSIKDPVTLLFSRVGGSFLISNKKNTKLPPLNLTGMNITGELRLEMESTSWKDDAKLILRNTSVGALHDGKDGWPNKLVMDGFIYNRLGGFTEEERDWERWEDRGTKWMIEWLAKHEPYSPQPYEQLAKVLRESGHKDMANEILFESKKRELAGLSWRTDDYPVINTRKLILAVIQCSIGHGYRYRYLLGWITFFWVLGVSVIGFTTKDLPVCMGQDLQNPIIDGFSYSLDMLLPIIRLEDWHYTKVCLSGFQKIYFYFQQIIGWFLASVLVAGLSGITKK